MKVRSLVLGITLSLVAAACDGAPAEGTSGGAPKTTGSAKPAAKPAASASAVASTAASAASSATPAASGSAEPAGSASAAAPAAPAPTLVNTDLTGKDFAGHTIGLPAGGKLNGNAVETPDYKLMLKKAGPKDEDLAGAKAALQKMPGFKSFVIDKPEGVVMEVEEKGKPQFALTRLVKVGDVTIVCESALTKPPTDKAKAEEAFAVCGSIAKK
jgi:hypothetical protein